MRIPESSRAQRCALIVAALLVGCVDEQSTLSASSVVTGKCAFQGIEFGMIRPGDIFLYTAFDSTNSTYAVVTGTAQHDEFLVDRQAMQDLAPVYSATPALNSLEFGDEKYIGTGNRSGEVHISGGETFGTDAVYPTCVFWPD